MEHGPLVVQSKKIIDPQYHLLSLANCPWPCGHMLSGSSNCRENQVPPWEHSFDLEVRNERIVTAILRKCHHRYIMEVNARWMWTCKTKHRMSNAFCPCQTCFSLCPPEFLGVGRSEVLSAVDSCFPPQDMMSRGCEISPGTSQASKNTCPLCFPEMPLRKVSVFEIGFQKSACFLGSGYSLSLQHYSFKRVLIFCLLSLAPKY